jgi:hypothetical protein
MSNSIIWTPKEEEFIRQNYYKIGPRATAEALGKPYRTVCGKASRLGVSKRLNVDKQRLSHSRARCPSCPSCNRLHHGVRGMPCLRCAVGGVEVG